DKGKSTAFLDTVDFRIQVEPSDPNYHILQSGGTINWGGQPLIKWKGPFATETEAKQAQNPKQQSPNPVSDAQNALTNSNANPLTDLNDLAHRLTEPHTWLRVGEFVIGGILVYIGIREAFPTQVAAVTAPVKSAAKAAGMAAFL